MHLVRTICEENTSCKNYAEKWTHFANSLLYEITRFVITLLYQYTSCYSFIVGKNASCYNYTVKRTHLARTILKSEHIFYKFTVSDNTSCYSFIVGENTSCWNYTLKRTHLAITPLYMGTHFSNSYCMRELSC